VTATANVTVWGLLVEAGYLASGVVEPIIYEVNSSTGAFISEVAVGPSYTPTYDFEGMKALKFSSPVILYSGTSYLLGLRRTDGTGTTSARLRFKNANTAYESAPFTVLGLDAFALNSTPVSSATPAVHQTTAVVWKVGVIWIP
jgi:hypothetical protein